LKAKDKTRVTTVEMTFVRWMEKLIQMDCKRNEDMLKELKIECILDMS
jgi:hypothetical protein